MGQAIFTPMKICLQENLSVRSCSKGISLRFEFGPQFQVIVYFTIEDDPDAGIPYRHRLQSTARQVDDRKAAVPKSNLGVYAPVPLVGFL
jgi:hypothetical protein